MSGNEPTTTRRRRTKIIGFLTAAGACAAAAAIVPVAGTGTAAALPTSEGMLCSPDYIDALGVRTFNLTATDGYTTEPDGNSIYNWSYTANGGFQLPGPVLCADTSQIIEINLTNNLKVATSIQFPGQTGVTVAGAPVGPVSDGLGNLVSLVPEATANGGTMTYRFPATNAGTYLYQSGSDPQLQVQMGLFGAIVIRPAGVIITAQDLVDVEGGAADLTAAAAHVGEAACAYASVTNPAKCDLSAIYEADRENLLMLSEVDPGLHSFMELNKADATKLTWNAYPRPYEAHYFLINGRSMPDTIAPNNAPWLPTQPYGSLASVEPWDAAVNPLDAMIRYVGVGVTGYDFHPHSNHENVIAQDGRLMKGATGGDFTEEKFNIMVGSGATVDATFRWTNEEGYSDTNGNRVPVQWPNNPNLQTGDFWSGSPYLGGSGNLNPGILSKTQCGEYYHVAHNHDLSQVTNYGLAFGGMLTLIKVEPPEAFQEAHNGCNQ